MLNALSFQSQTVQWCQNWSGYAECCKQESSAKLTNQRVSYAFTSSPLIFHPVIFCLLPSSSIVIRAFYLFSTVYAYTANFWTVFSESQNASPLDAEHEPDFNAKWPFKVIRFGVNEEPLRGYIVQYNNCGLECVGSEDIASERSENRHLRRPHFNLTPPL